MILASPPPPLSYSQMPSNATAARAAPSKSGGPVTVTGRPGPLPSTLTAVGRR